MGNRNVEVPQKVREMSGNFACLACGHSVHVLPRDCCLLLIWQEELKMLRQQLADYVDNMQHLSDREAYHVTLSSGTRSDNADGKLIISLHVTVWYNFFIFIQQPLQSD